MKNEVISLLPPCPLPDFYYLLTFFFYFVIAYGVYILFHNPESLGLLALLCYLNLLIVHYEYIDHGFSVPEFFILIYRLVG